MATRLLQTKLYIPPLRPERAARLRLIERLTAGLRHRLTLISAPAGFGKTTLLSEWTSHSVGLSNKEIAKTLVIAVGTVKRLEISAR